MTTPTIHIDERECAFTHEGQTFTALGAYVDDDYACIYAIEREFAMGSAQYRNNPSGIATSWDGAKLGFWTTTRAYQGGFRSRMRAIRVTLDDGRQYAGRYAPDNGDFVRCKRVNRKQHLA